MLEHLMWRDGGPSQQRLWLVQTLLASTILSKLLLVVSVATRAGRLFCFDWHLWTNLPTSRRVSLVHGGVATLPQHRGLLFRAVD